MTIPDDSGCGAYRVRYPGQTLADSDPDIEVRFVETLKARLDLQGRVLAVQDPECDVIVMSRPLRRINVEMIPGFQRAGVAVVVDIDDDFDNIATKHCNWKWFQPDQSPESNREWVKRAAAAADLVTVTTPALAELYAPHGRVAILPNFVPKSYLDTKPEPDAATIGWPGHVETHPYDLDETWGGVALACDRIPADFRNIGSGTLVKEKLGLTPNTRLEITGSVPLDEYIQRVSQLTVGIAPLAGTMFNQSKSALKGLEMASQGVPFVASALPDYERLHADGLGLLAKPRTRDWAGALMEAYERRDELGPAGREIVAAKHTYEGNTGLWLDAWKRAMKFRQNREISLIEGVDYTRHEEIAEKFGSLDGPGKIRNECTRQ